MIKRDSVYKHYKGGLYKVICIAKHSETLEEMVVYYNIDNETKIWIRPKNMFEDKVFIDGKFIERFKFIK